MYKRFRSKSVEKLAARWFRNGDHPEDACEILVSPQGDSFLSEGQVVRYFRHPEVPGTTYCKHCSIDMHQHGWIDTLEGGHIVCPGDWVITGLAGSGEAEISRYPCKPDIFEKSYEEIKEVLP